MVAYKPREKGPHYFLFFERKSLDLALLLEGERENYIEKKGGESFCWNINFLVPRIAKNGLL